MANKGKNINIPARAILKAINNPETFDMLCTWACIRNLYNNGVYKDVTQKKIRQDFGVGKQRGKEIFEGIKKSSFFTMETPTRLRLVSLKDSSAKFDKNGRCYYSDVVFKIPVGTYSLNEMKKVLREMVVCYFINAVERKEGLLGRSRNCYHAPRITSITMQQLATTLNVSVSTISRMTSKMHNKGLIKKEPAMRINNVDQRDKAEVERVLNMYNRKGFTFTDRNGISYIVSPCKYMINSRDMSERFAHKIYDYEYKDCGTYKRTCTIPQLLGY